ncbi:hypothetical protein [Nocardia africana]|uniref:Uncharacterized protein n=1 Tax=Nocardia africana TaxID=134964 RepID=A0A378WR05_9NOCA|nr:hypothetical protein [Nocardia africana]SUA43678.1 Uncharacterised protein [Nocardia africana]
MYPTSMRDEMNNSAGQRLSTGIEQSQHSLRRVDRESGPLFQQA